MALSAVRIPVQNCPPEIQRDRKNNRRCNVRNRKPLFSKLKMLFSLLLFSTLAPNQVYAIPGTKYAIATGETSQDLVRQQNYAATAIR